MSAVGILHFVLRKSFLLVSFDRDGAYEQGLRVRWWDFLFYALFGLVVTSFVRIAGVLLVFSYLIVPAVCGINLARKLGSPTAYRLGYRSARWSRRVVLLQLGSALGRGHCLHVWRAPDFDFAFQRYSTSSLG